MKKPTPDPKKGHYFFKDGARYYYVPTQEDSEALTQFSEYVTELESRTGIAIDGIAVRFDSEASYAAQSTGNKKGMIALPYGELKTKNYVNKDGSLTHEAGHIYNNDSLLGDQLSVLTRLPKALNELRGSPESITHIKNQFGSIEIFNQKLNEVNRIYGDAEAVLPQLRKYIASMPIDSAESLADSYSENPQRVIELQKTLGPIAQYADVEEFCGKIATAMNAAQKDSRERFKFTLGRTESEQPPAEKQLLLSGVDKETLDSLSQKYSDIKDIEDFQYVWRRSREYAADEFSVKKSLKPEEMIECVRQHHQQIENICLEHSLSPEQREQLIKALDEEDPHHPREIPRIDRMEKVLSSTRKRER